MIRLGLRRDMMVVLLGAAALVGFSAAPALGACTCTGYCQDKDADGDGTNDSSDGVTDVSGCAASLAECTTSTTTVCGSRTPAQGVDSVDCPAAPNRDVCPIPGGGDVCSVTCMDGSEFETTSATLPECTDFAVASCSATGVWQASLGPVVPTVTRWGFVVMVGLVLTAGTVAIARRRIRVA
ncbi:MAG: hypothetical protein ACE5HE_03520 [Phycisphaerae bacterium]